MDARTLDNWRRIKEAMEAFGNTNNPLYRRVLAILAGRPDPLDQPWRKE